MQGSLYPNGVLIDRTALRRTETSKASQILRMRTDVTSRGVLSGGEITVSLANPDRIDIAAFAGYTPRGDYIERTSSKADVALSDYIIATVNVICAVYTESSIHNQPHETDGNTYPTEAEGTYRIRVFSQADFDNPLVLPATDTNLQNDALDRCLILGKVTAEGPSNPLTTIQDPTDYDNILYTSPQNLNTVTGVTILSADPDTPTGTGTITFDDTAAPTYSFKYTSPGGVISIAYTTTADAVLNMTDGSGYWIEIQVLVSQLPLGLAVPYAETFEIINLYYQAVPRLTADDHLHRNFLGTGILTPNNPHGQSLDDFAGTTLSLLDEHQDVMHCNGIWKGSAAGIFDGSVNTGTALGDTLNITAPVASDIFYVNGAKQTTIDINQMLFSPANVTGGFLGAGSHLGAKLFEFYVDDNETLVANLRLEYPDPRNCSGTWIVDMSPDHPAGSFDLRMVISAGPSATVSLQWGDTDSYAESVPTPTVSGVTGQVVRVYHPDNVNWIDVYVGDDAGATDRYLPAAGTYTDTITVSAALDRGEHMQFMSVPYWYDTVTVRGSIGYPPYGGTRTIPDTRLWGNTCVTNMADAALDHMAYYPTFEYQRSGLVNRRHLGNETDWQVANLSAPSLDLRVSGGVCYIRGKRLEVEGEDPTLLDNQTTIIWVDYAGTLHYDDFSATPFTSSYQQAIEWIVGYPQDRDVDDYTTYLTDSEVTPQRGLPLYVITTLAGAVTTTVDLRRFVGAHVVDWSVGADTDGGQFASLEAAFAYAAHETQSSVSGTRSITIKLVGASTITTTVVQPSNVIVEGSWDSSNIVTVSPSVPDTDGSWQLSASCIVRDVYVNSTVAGPTFGIANNVLLDHILFTSATGNFTTLTQSATDVIIKECSIRADLGMFYEPGAFVASFDRMKIKDCYIYSTTSQGTALIRLDYAPYSEITGNNISKDNTDIEPVIEVSSSDGARIEKNLVRIGQGDGSAVEKGIYVTDSVGVQIKGNIVTTVSGSTSIAGIGIQAADCSEVIIEENIVNFMGQGILAGAYSLLPETAYFENATISNNLVSSCYSCGIMANANTNGTIANTLVGLRIEGNQVHQIAKSAAADALFGADLSGIYVVINDTTLTTVRDIIVKNNTIDGVDNLQAAGNTSGLLVIAYVSTTVDSLMDTIELDDNSIARVTCILPNYYNGIIVQVSSGNPATGVISNVSCSRNNIILASTGAASTIEGIYLYTGVNNDDTYRVNIDDNNIYIATAAPYTDVGDGIVVANTSLYAFKESSINNNTIQVPWYGIRSSVQQSSTINNNNIYAGSVGICAPVIANSSISNNYIRVDSNNENIDLDIDTVNYGQMGILVTTSCVAAAIKNNKVELHKNYSTNNLSRGSASYALASGSSYFEFEGNSTIHYYTDLAATGGTEQAFHVYIADSDYVWSCSRNTIYNDGKYNPEPSKSHGLYIAWPGGSPSSTQFRGVVNDNVIFGSIPNTGGFAWYEFFIASIGTPTQGAVISMNNYLSLYMSIPAASTIPNMFYPSVSTNGVNLRDRWDAGVNWTVQTF